MPSSLEQQRRAVGTAMTARRGTGEQMAARRNGRKAVEDINSLVSPASQRKTLTTLDPRGRLEAKQGRGDYVEPTTAGGVGIASPLTEQSYAQREYHPQGEFTSDGLFYLPAIKKIVLTDADGTVGEVLLAAPPAPVTP